MSDYVLELSFKSPVRLGKQGREEQATREWIPADQLFSWLCLGWLRLWGETGLKASVLEPFLAGRPPWTHSDGFPVVDNDMFLPAPAWAAEDKGAPDKKSRTAWVSREAFFPALQDATPPPPESYARPRHIIMLNNVRINAHKGKDNEPFYTAAVQAPSQPDRTNTSSRYAAFLKCQDPAVVAQLKLVVGYLRDEGMGGNRSSGLGAIEDTGIVPAGQKHAIPPARRRFKRFVILSPCYPTERMLAALKQTPPGTNSYSLVFRGGWIYDQHGRATDIRKPTTYLFETGSLFGLEPEGRLVDVSNGGRPCYRYGIPYVVEA